MKKKNTGNETTQSSAKRYRKISEVFDDFSFKKKLIIVYLCCLIPLMLTSFTILYMVAENEWRETEKELAGSVLQVETELRGAFSEAIELVKNLYINKQLSDFLKKQYGSAEEFYQGYREIVNSYMLSFRGRSNLSEVVVYTDNNTIVNSERIRRIDHVKDDGWYLAYKESGRDIYVAVYYDSLQSFYKSGRTVSLIRKMDYSKTNPHEDILKLDFDCLKVGQTLFANNHKLDLYVCTDNKIIFSNLDDKVSSNDFHLFEEDKLDGKVRRHDIEIYGREWNIYAVKTESVLVNVFRKNSKLLFLVVMLCFACPLPAVIYFYRSVVGRIGKLAWHLDNVQVETFELIEDNNSKDEIGKLLQNYNKMVIRIQDLIQIAYKEKIERQELELSKQQAELQALHSQINPHFVFNALESIRMRSLIKEEVETAERIENLAILMRKSVDWGNDNITIREEMEFVSAFLELQQYRFGEKLHYKLDVDEECLDFKIPKLTIVTFVENSCVHGIEESQISGWIFVSVLKEENHIVIEIEDTGKGMYNKEVIISKINNANIETIEKSKSIGILNACTRLKMFTNNQVRFSLETEPRVGTTITIEIPVNE